MATGDFSTRSRQYAAPLLIDGLDESGTVRALERLEFNAGDIRHDEGWLQRLIFRFPQVLPVHEIEPGFGRVMPVCLELPSRAGSADNFFVTDSGDLILAECKLWRNPEARREVVAQIIDYAHAMASWTYEDLEEAIRKAAVPEGGNLPEHLYDLVEEAGEIAEEDFVDAVSRNLRLGRMLLLIVGDGVREGVESLSGYLQRHAGFHFTLGVIELPVFQMPEGGFLVQPRTLARTVNIERGIVKIHDGRAVIEASPAHETADRPARRTSISQDRLLEMLAEVDPDLPEKLQAFVERGAEQGIFMDSATRSLQIRWRSPTGHTIALGGINARGELETYNVNWQPELYVGRLDLAHDYQEKIATLVGGEVRKTPNPAARYVVKKGTKVQPPVTALLAHGDEWLAVIADYTKNLGAALQESSGS